MIEVLSLGAGVQSSTVLLMSIRGELPKLEHAIFADTGWEPIAVYRHLEWLAGEAESVGIKLHVVTQGNLKHDALQRQVRGKKMNGARWASMPYFTMDRETGKHGMIRRQCTYEYKIRPIERCLRQEVLGLRPKQHGPKSPCIRQWRGISFDEWQRVRKSDHKWMTTWHPLVDRKITRNGCYEWMESHGYPEPPRSACIGCPFHHDREWRHLRDNSPTEWQEAVAFDKAVRTCGGMKGDVYLHAARVPLDEVDLSTDVDKGQGLLWQDECSGMCGV